MRMRFAIVTSNWITFLRYFKFAPYVAFEQYRDGFSIEFVTLTLKDHGVHAHHTPLLELKSSVRLKKNDETIRVSNAFNHRTELTQQFIHYQLPYKWTCDISLIIGAIHTVPHTFINNLDKYFPTTDVVLP